MGKKGRRNIQTDTYKNRVLEAFEKADENKDGTISRAELGKTLLKLDPEFSEEKVNLLFSGIDTNENDVIEVSEFVDWIFSGGDSESIGRAAVEAAKQSTVAACETVPSALSRIGSTLGDIRVTVNDVGGKAVLSDFGLFPGDTILILRHAAEAAMTRKLGYRCKMLFGETFLADEDTVSGCGLETGSVLTTVLTIDPQLQNLMEKLPKLLRIAREGDAILGGKSDDEIEEFNREAFAILRQVNELGCFGTPKSPLTFETALRDPPNAGQRGIPGWSGCDVLGPVVPLLGEWLQDPNPEVRNLACWCLGRAGVDALPCLPHLAAAAWNTRYGDLCGEAADALCLLAAQAPQQVVPVVTELICHDLVGVSRRCMEWLTYAGKSILFWRPMPDAKEMAKDRIKQACFLVSKDKGDPIPTAKVAAKFLKTQYSDLFETVKDKLHPKVLKALEPDSEDEGEQEPRCPCWDFCGLDFSGDEGGEEGEVIVYLPTSIGKVIIGEEEE